MTTDPVTVATDVPPPFETVTAKVLDLQSTTSSKIASISLYASRAEITRIFKVPVVVGLNQLNIVGLPNALEQDTLRVEGKGAATIHDVTIASMPPTPVPTTSDTLKDLEGQKEDLDNALARAKKSLASLEKYLGTVAAQHVVSTDLAATLDNYDQAATVLDRKVSKLNKDIVEVDEKIRLEKEKLKGPKENDKLRMKACVAVFAEKAGDVQVNLIYAVRLASWNAGYDIRADTDTKEKPIKLIYKAIITQSTGEDWTDVPLTLETANPSFGVGIPTLNQWTVSVYRPVYHTRKMSKGGGGLFATVGSAKKAVERRRSVYSAYDPTIEGPDEEEAEAMVARETLVTSKGNVSATFRVPGIITIPSDGAAHNFTIANLELDATMTWISVPKEDTKVHLKAKIHNYSDYTLLPGSSSVYVNGSFISRSNIPSVSPQESFDCSLGLDPSVRVTYHPRNKKVTESGFYTKNTAQVFTQRISIHNTKLVSIGLLKILDNIPVSEDSTITVKLTSPSLSVPSSSGTSTKVPTGKDVAQPVKVSEGVVANWEGADEPDVDVESIGRDGKLNWTCQVPAQGKLNLTLSYEVAFPAKTPIVGL